MEHSIEVLKLISNNSSKYQVGRLKIKIKITMLGGGITATNLLPNGRHATAVGWYPEQHI